MQDYLHSILNAKFMCTISQNQKADQFRQQHLNNKLLILPNIWDTFSAKFIESLGFPSLATASAATAASTGYKDGENIPFAELLALVKQITATVTIPLSVDLERGYADSLSQLTENVALLVENGAIGLNIEDGKADGNGLFSIDEQCRKIDAIKETGIKLGVPVVINARTDIFLQTQDNALPLGIFRAKAYKEAGADCFYPVLINDFESISQLIKEVNIPVNVFLLESINDLTKLESIGVSRISVGPNLLKHSLTAIRNAAEGLLNYQTEDFFNQRHLTKNIFDSLY